MTTARWSALSGALLAACCFASAQAPVQSPKDSVRAVFDGARITVLYGKPSVRGRVIFGGAVPFYKVWRTGAGEATILRTEADLEMNGAVIPRGTYSLYSIPAADRWKLIINKQTGQWGTVYNPQLDLARLEATPRALRTPVEDLSIKLEKSGADAGQLRIDWDRTSVSIPFRVSRDTLVPSPRDSASLRLGTARIAIDYGSPSKRGRSIFGGIVPYGKVWRTGANAATSLTTTADLVIGGVVIPKGEYTLYTIPGSKEWRVIVNTQTGQWGTVYDARRDLARIPIKRRTTKSLTERLTITLRETGSSSGELRLMWEKTLLVLPFRVKR